MTDIRDALNSIDQIGLFAVFKTSLESLKQATDDELQRMAIRVISSARNILLNSLCHVLVASFPLLHQNPGETAFAMEEVFSAHLSVEQNFERASDDLASSYCLTCGEQFGDPGGVFRAGEYDILENANLLVASGTFSHCNHRVFVHCQEVLRNLPFQLRNYFITVEDISTFST